MKISLIRPPAGYATGKKPNIKRGLYLLPQSLIYLGEALVRAGHEVQIIDIEERRISLKEVIQILDKISPDIVGLTTTTPSWPFVATITKEIKENFPELKVIIGGPHAMFDYQTILNQQLADLIAIGESEYSFPAYIASTEANTSIDSVHGIAFARNDTIIYTGISPMIDIDTWGFPAYQLLNIEEYKKVGGVSISAMRGCPYECAFCLNHRIHNTNPLQPKTLCKPRLKSAQTIFNEMLYLHQQYGVEEFSFIDPIFTYCYDRVDRLCDLLIKESISFKWCCQTRVDSVTDELLDQMSKAGCVGILFGVESENEEVLKRIDKKTSKQIVVDAFQMCKQAGIQPTPSFIMGLPGDSVRSVQNSIDFAKEMNDKFELGNYIQFNTFMPSPGSLVQEDLDKYQIEINYDISYSYWVLVPVTSTPNLPYKKHLELWHKIWETFFPEYFDLYLELEECAFNKEDFLLEIFIEGIDENEI